MLILLATLRKIGTDDGWLHYNLAKHLGVMLKAGVPEAKLPAIIHSLLTVEKLKEIQASATTLPLSILASELINFAPREAGRSASLVVKEGISEQEIYAALTPVFQRIFSRPDIVLRPEMHSGDIPRWDSFANFELMLAVEDTFDIRLGVEEIGTLKNVGGLVAAVMTCLKNV